MVEKEYSFVRARDFLDRSLSLYRSVGDDRATAQVLYNLAYLTSSLDTTGQGEELLRESLALRQALGDELGAAETMMGLALYLEWQGRMDEGLSLAQQSISILRAKGDRHALAMGLDRLGWVFQYNGQFVEAQRRWEECWPYFEDLGRHPVEADIGIKMGFSALLQGDYDRARAFGDQALAAAREWGLQRSTSASLVLLGELAMAHGEFVAAQRLFNESLTVSRVNYQQEVDHWTYACLAMAESASGHHEQAVHHLSECLEGLLADRVLHPLLFALTAAALLYVAQGKVERGIELYTVASAHPYVSNSTWFEDIAGKSIRQAGRQLPADLVEAAQRRGRQGGNWQMAIELLAELSTAVP
jgi:tetratricopeptide (TPR) repeat protein